MRCEGLFSYNHPLGIILLFFRALTLAATAPFLPFMSSPPSALADYRWFVSLPPANLSLSLVALSSSSSLSLSLPHIHTRAYHTTHTYTNTLVPTSPSRLIFLPSSVAFLNPSLLLVCRSSPHVVIPQLVPSLPLSPLPPPLPLLRDKVFGFSFLTQTGGGLPFGELLRDGIVAGDRA
jgi:hypothetical protein